MNHRLPPQMCALDFVIYREKKGKTKATEYSVYSLTAKERETEKSHYNYSIIFV